MTFQRISGIGGIRQTISVGNTSRHKLAMLKQKLTAWNKDLGTETSRLPDVLSRWHKEVSDLIQYLEENSSGELDDMIDDLKALKIRIEYPNTMA